MMILKTVISKINVSVSVFFFFWGGGRGGGVGLGHLSLFDLMEQNWDQIIKIKFQLSKKYKNLNHKAEMRTPKLTSYIWQKKSNA